VAADLSCGKFSAGDQRPMTIDQIEIGWRHRITLTYFQPIGWKCQ